MHSTLINDSDWLTEHADYNPVTRAMAKLVQDGATLTERQWALVRQARQRCEGFAPPATTPDYVTPTPAPAAPVATGPAPREIYPGIYTVETPSGHRTFKIVVQDDEDDFAPGRTIISFLSGPDNEADYTQFAFLDGRRLRLWKKYRHGHTSLVDDAMRLLADPDAALVQAHCIRCNRALTVPTSIHNGYGPDCIKMVRG